MDGICWFCFPRVREIFLYLVVPNKRFGERRQSSDGRCSLCGSFVDKGENLVHLSVRNIFPCEVRSVWYCECSSVEELGVMCVRERYSPCGVGWGAGGGSSSFCL